MVRVRCRKCNTELSSSAKPQCCGCSNQMILKDDTVTAVDLSDVMLIKSEDSIKDHESPLAAAKKKQYYQSWKK